MSRLGFILDGEHQPILAGKSRYCESIFRSKTFYEELVAEKEKQDAAMGVVPLETDDEKSKKAHVRKLVDWLLDNQIKEQTREETTRELLSYMIEENHNLSKKLKAASRVVAEEGFLVKRNEGAQLAKDIYRLTLCGKMGSGKDSSAEFAEQSVKEGHGIKSSRCKFAGGLKEVCARLADVTLEDAYNNKGLFVKPIYSDQFSMINITSIESSPETILSIRNDLLGVVKTRVSGQNKDNRSNGFDWTPYVNHLTSILTTYDENTGRHYLFGFTLGTMQQKLGEGMRKLVNNNFWVDLLRDEQKAYEAEDFIIETDGRYPSEVIESRAQGQLIIRMEGDPSGERARNVTGRDLNHSSETALDNYDGFNFVIQNVDPVELLDANLQKIFSDLSKGGHSFVPKEKAMVVHTNERA